jgi:cyanophycin synthetase
MDFGVVEIGHGKKRRHFLGSLEGGNAVVAVQASNKLVIKRQLLRAGVPVPAYRVVTDENQALATAQAMGWPVVLKPIDQSQGRGVTANIWRAADLLRAYRKARSVSQNPLIVERHALGNDHRLLVVDGKVVAAVGFPYVEVRGNGFQTLGQLIELAKKACSDDEAAANYRSDKESRRLIDEQGLGLEDVVESGRVVQLRRRRNPPPLRGSIVDVLDDLHPDLKRLAVRATAAMGMGLAGLDVITPDVTQPPLASGAVVLELNPRPYLGSIRASPRSKDIDRQVFEASFPQGQDSIPIVLLDGSQSGDRLVTALENHLKDDAQVVGCWTSQGEVRVGGEEMVWLVGEESREAPGQLVLGDSRVEVALLNLSLPSWLADGHPCSGYSLGVLMEGEPLLEKGLLAEWLAVVKGPVVIVAGSQSLLGTVESLVGDRLVAVADEGAAVEAIRAALKKQANLGATR